MMIIIGNLVWAWQAIISFFCRSRFFIFILWIISALAAAYYSAYNSPDHILYNNSIDSYGRSPFSYFWSEIRFIEPFFLIVVKIFNRLDLSHFFVFLLFSAISVALKINLIRLKSTDVTSSLLVYFSYFFLIHDSTQIRASVAIGILYWAAYYLSNGRGFIFLVVTTISAALFHVSSIVFFPVFFFGKKWATNFIIALCGVSFSLFVAHMSVMSLFNLILQKFGGVGVGLTKLDIYVNSVSDDSFSNPLGVISLLSICVGAALYKSRSEMNKFELICYNCFLFSIMVTFLFYDFGVMQTRIRAIYSFGLVFIFPILVKKIGKLGNFGRGATLALIAVAMFGAFQYFAIIKGLILGE